MFYSKIFLELNPQSENTSAETTLIEQDNEVCYKADKNPGKTSSHSKTGITKNLMVQTTFIIYVLQAKFIHVPIVLFVFLVNV